MKQQSYHWITDQSHGAMCITFRSTTSPLRPFRAHPMVKCANIKIWQNIPGLNKKPSVIMWWDKNQLINQRIRPLSDLIQFAFHNIANNSEVVYSSKTGKSVKFSAYLGINSRELSRPQNHEIRNWNSSKRTL